MTIKQQNKKQNIVKIQSLVVGFFNLLMLEKETEIS